MILSIVIPFCDNDYQFLDRAVSSIKEHVKFDDYEIVAVDNREKDKSQININNVKIVSSGHNLGCFDGRRFGVSYSQGIFIWNFDVDDLMVGDLYREDIKEDADVMQMYYIYNTGPRYDQKMLPVSYGVNVWSRLYKAEIVKNFYAKLEKPIKIFMREDSLLFDAVYRTAKVWKYIPKVIYEYNFKNARFNKYNKGNNKKSKMSEQEAKETYENYKYIYNILGTPEKADALFRRVKEVSERGY
jgi:hypothetical protein